MKALFLLAATLGTFCLTSAFAKTPIVFVDDAKSVTLYDTLSFPARVNPESSAQVVSDADGQVDGISVSLGQKVGQGQVMFIVKHTDPVYQYMPVQVVAPLQGVVSQVAVSRGTRVSKGQVLGSVTNPSKVKIQAEVPVGDLSMLSVGQVGQLDLSAGHANAKPVDVRIQGLSPLVDPATGTSTVELVAVNKKQLGLLPGRLGKLSFRVNERRGIQVPESAIVYRGTNTFLRVVDGTKAKQIDVVVARIERGMAEISKGLQDGQKVVMRASGFVADGAEVVVEAQGASANKGAKVN